MSDIAAAVGVSRPVVSSIFSQTESQTIRVSEATRRRVLEAARRMGYRPNEIARSVATGKTHVVAFIGSVMRYQFAAATLSGVMTAADEHNYAVKVMQSTETLEAVAVADRVLGRRVDGVIAFHLETPIWRELVRELGGAVPVVSLDCMGHDGAGAVIQTDNATGCRAVLDHLVKLGHRRVGFIAGDARASNAREPEFLAAARAAGLPTGPGLIEPGDWTLEGAEAATRRLLALPSDGRPTAIFCASDQMAMATLRTARALGFDVPGDLSVVGFGDLDVAEMADPPLTSVHQPYESMGQQAFSRLLTLMDASPATPPAARTPAPPSPAVVASRIDIPTTLSVRASTGPAPR